MMEKRKIGVLCVCKGQDGNEARQEIWMPGTICGIRSYSNECVRNGVRIVLAREMKESVIGVSRASNRVMDVKSMVVDGTVNSI